MTTTSITVLDVAIVAKRLKMVVSDEIICQIAREYPNYAKDRPTENWSEIIELMLYDYTGPVIRYIPPVDRFHTDGDGDVHI